MCVGVADQCASASGTVVGDRRRTVGGDYVDIEIDEPVAGDIGVGASYSMGSVTHRAGESVVDMASVLGEGGIGDDLGEVVALAAEGVGPGNREIGIRKEVADGGARRGGLTNFVAPFKNVRPLGTVWPIGPRASEFAIVIRVMAVSAEDARSHVPAERGSVELQHLSAQARLRKSAIAVVHHGMAGARGQQKLRDDVEGISQENHTCGQIAESDVIHNFARAGTVATQAIVILVDRRIDHGHPVAGVDAHGS